MQAPFSKAGGDDNRGLVLADVSKLSDLVAGCEGGDSDVREIEDVHSRKRQPLSGSANFGVSGFPRLFGVGNLT